MMTITTDGIFVDIQFGGVHDFLKDAYLRIDSVRSVDLMSDDAGVMVVFTSHNSEVFHYSVIDSIDGDSSITSNLILRDKLRGIVNPV